MNRVEALQLLKLHVREPANTSHALEAEAVMRKLAAHLGEDVEKWGMCGLLHDLDWEKCKDTPETHGLVTAKMLAETSVDPEIVKAIPSHNFEYNGSPAPSTRMEIALMPAETVTGIIVACVLVRPDKDIAAMPLKSIKKKLKDKSFARNVNRETIATIEKLEIPQDEFIELARVAIAEIQSELTL